MEKVKITQERLKGVMHYNPETGVFTWLKHRKKMYIGTEAGTKNSGYLWVQIDGERLSLHRLVWLYVYGRMPNQCIDHLDGDTTNNRLSNLRDVSLSENQKNRRIGGNNSSGIMGVFWHKQSKKWVSSIGVNKKLIHLGSFNSVDEARNARISANIKYGYHQNHGVERRDAK